MANYEIHTDGCVMPHGKGGWAYTSAPINNPDNYQIASDAVRCSDPHSTELKAVGHALPRTRPRGQAAIYTDSDYVYRHAAAQQAPAGSRDADSWPSVPWRLIPGGSAELNRVCDQPARALAQR